MKLNIKKNRKNKSWSFSEFLLRFLWWLCSPFFYFSFPKLWFFRNFLVKLFGGKIGKNVRISNTCKIAIPWNIEISDYAAIGDRVILYSLGKIYIGQRSTISQGSHLCAGTHDHTDKSRPLIKKSISIKNDVWVSADAFIGPGTIISNNSIVGARAVVTKNVPENVIVVGNPAKDIKKTNE